METTTSRPGNAASVPVDTANAVDGQSTVATEAGENPMAAVHPHSTTAASSTSNVCTPSASVTGMPVAPGSTTSTTQVKSCTPFNSESKGETTIDDTSETTSYEALFEKLGNKGATMVKGTIGGTAAAPVAHFSSPQEATKRMFPHAFGSVPSVSPATLTSTMTISSQTPEAAILPAPTTTSSAGAESTIHTQALSSDPAVALSGGGHSSMSSLNGTSVLKSQAPGREQQLNNKDTHAVSSLSGL